MNQSKVVSLFLAGAVCVASVSGSSTRQARFDGLGVPDDGAYQTRAWDVSATGRVVAGQTELRPNVNAFILEEAFTWNDAGGLNPLGFFPGGIPGGSRALGISPTGETAVGRSTGGDFLPVDQAFKWTRQSGLQALPQLDVLSFSKATAASRGGQTIVGTNEFYFPAPARNRAVRWQGNDVLDLGSLAPNGQSEGIDVSASGAIIAGNSASLPHITTPLVRDGLSFEPFLWSESMGMVGLGHLQYLPADVPHAYQDTRVGGISADGGTVVGTSRVVSLDGLPDLMHRAFIWDQAGGMRDLGDLPFLVCCLSYDAVDVAARGDVVIGNAVLNGSSLTFPFLWTEADGMRTLEEILLFDYGLNQTGQLDGWQLGEVAAISSNGRAIVGNGINPDGIAEAWRVILSGGRAQAGHELGITHARSVPEPAPMGVAMLVMLAIGVRRMKSEVGS